MKGIGKTTAIKQNGAGKKKKFPGIAMISIFCLFSRCKTIKHLARAADKSLLPSDIFANQSQNKSQII